MHANFILKNLIIINSKKINKFINLKTFKNFVKTKKNQVFKTTF